MWDWAHMLYTWKYQVQTAEKCFVAVENLETSSTLPGNLPKCRAHAGQVHRSNDDPQLAIDTDVRYLSLVTFPCNCTRMKSFPFSIHKVLHKSTGSIAFTFSRSSHLDVCPGNSQHFVIGPVIVEVILSFVLPMWWQFCNDILYSFSKFQKCQWCPNVGDLYSKWKGGINVCVNWDWPLGLPALSSSQKTLGAITASCDLITLW